MTRSSPGRRARRFAQKFNKEMKTMKLTYREIQNLYSALQSLDNDKDVKFPAGIKARLIKNMDELHPWVVDYQRQMQEAQIKVQTEISEKGWGRDMMIPMLSKEMEPVAKKQEEVNLIVIKREEFGNSVWTAASIEVERAMKPIIEYPPEKDGANE